jgi:L-arabinose 1-dehydrogenase [NAD(P)+]
MTHNVAVTGAAGSIGRVTLEALEDGFEVTPLTHREHDDIDSVVIDIINGRKKLTEAFAGNSTVVHLAGNPSPEADWESVLQTNINGTYNVFEAARQAGVDRIIFASTNHVQHMYNAADPGSPELTGTDTRPVSPDDPARPDSYYGVSKLTGEGLGSYYADRHGMNVINFRIGWLLTREELLNYQNESEGRARQARVLWLSPRDWRHAIRQAIKTDLSGVETLVAQSRNQERYFSLIETMRTIGFQPQDDSSEVVTDDTNS